MAKRICSVEDCDRKHRARGLCHYHYLRGKRDGSITNLVPVCGPEEPEDQRTRRRRLQYQRRYREENKEREDAARRTYMARPGIREARIEQIARWSGTAPGRYSHFKSGAGQRGLAEGMLTYEEWLEIASNPCTYCGAPPFGTKVGSGIDRVDSSIGYLVGNSVPCCHLCNMMKRAMNVEDFLAHARQIAAHSEHIAQSDAA